MAINPDADWVPSKGVRLRKSASLAVDKATSHAPVKFWAAFGVLWAIFYLYLGFSWVSGPHFTPTLPGPTPLPEWMELLFKYYVPAGLVAFAFTVWWFAIRPRLRTGEWTSDGLMLFVFIIFVFQDPFINYWQPVFTYNAALPNMGSWLSYVPGWQSIQAGEPGKTMGYPLTFLVPAYVYMLYTLALASTWIMRKTKERFPNISALGLISASMVFGIIVDLLAEGAWVRTGFYGYWGVDPRFTLFYGHYYQFPLYEALLTAAFWTGYACMRYYKNDRGENIFERGIEEMNLSKAKKGALRFFALISGCSCIYMVSYNLPYQFFNLKGHEWPMDVQERSYFTNYICGPETDQACPSVTMPNAKRGSVHFDPEGNLVIPEGVPAPGTETATKFRTTAD
jgi:hypothetical protein